MLKIKDLSFSYGKNKILNNLNINIKEGTVTTLMGANGCGKSTLMSLMTKNLSPDSGSIELDGCDIKEIPLKEFAKKAAIVHQKNTAPDDISVERLISYGRLPYTSVFKPALGDEDQQYVERALRLAGLEELRDRRMGTLSGGQRQRAFIAMALAQNTKLLFMDEPTTSLDVRYQIEVLRLAQRLNREEGITVVMVLHDINQTIEYSDEVVGLCSGGVVMQGAPEEVIEPEVLEKIYGIRLPVFRAEGRLCVMSV